MCRSMWKVQVEVLTIRSVRGEDGFLGGSSDAYKVNLTKIETSCAQSKDGVSLFCDLAIDGYFKKR